jgi:opacity protein-like surface antigen
MNLIGKILLIGAIGVQTIHSANILAVLEITPGDDDIELTISEYRYLTDELRKMARETLPREFSVLTRDAIMQLLPPDEAEAECLAEGCAVDIGRAISADYVTQGQIRKFGDKLTLTVELFETMSGNMVGSFAEVSEDLMGLLKIAREKSAGLFGKLPEPQKELKIENGELRIEENIQLPVTEKSILKFGFAAKGGIAINGAEHAKIGIAYSVGLIAAIDLGLLGIVPELRFSVDNFKINEKDISVMKIDMPLTARVVLLDAVGLSAGAVAALPLSANIDGKTPKDAEIGIAATGGISYLVSENIFINASYEKYFIETFKSVKNSSTDRVLCGMGYFF